MIYFSAPSLNKSNSLHLLHTLALKGHKVIEQKLQLS